MKRSYPGKEKNQEEKFLFLFEDGSKPVYFSADRYLTKAELREIEEEYGIRFKGYVTPVEKLCEFNLCNLIETAIEKWIGN